MFRPSNRPIYTPDQDGADNLCGQLLRGVGDRRAAVVGHSSEEMTTGAYCSSPGR
jgi:hypothetical protein